jgi:Tfp pilus assembly PilM family ATPase
MPKKELDIAAVSEARRKMLPTPGPDSIFYNSVLREVTIGKVPRYEVLVAKTEKNYVNEIVNLFSSYPDILPSFINPNCYAVAGHYSRKFAVGAKEAAFVDLGYESIDVSIAGEGKLRFYRNIKFGLKDIISHIGLALGKESVDMEKIIRGKGVPEAEIDLDDKVRVAEEIMRQKYEATAGAVSDDVNLLELRMLWSGEIERIVHEIRRTLIYYKEQTGGDRVDTLQFLGGGAAIKGLVPALAKDLGGTNTLIAAFDGITAGDTESLGEARQLQMLYAGAVSLAMGLFGARKGKAGLDFLPEELKKRRQVIQQQIGVIVFVIIIASVAFLVWLNFFIANRLVSMEIANTKREISHSDNVIIQLEALNSEKELIKKKSQKVIDIMDSRIDAVALFRTVAQAIPAEVTLSGFSLDKAVAADRKSAGPVFRVRMQAFCVSDYQQAVNLAHDFRHNLEKNDAFSGVNLVMPELEKIKPVAGQEGDMILTETIKRTFSLEVLIGPSARTAAVRQSEQ